MLINEAVTAGSRLAPACQETEICLRTYRRWVKADGVVLEDQRPTRDGKMVSGIIVSNYKGFCFEK